MKETDYTTVYDTALFFYEHNDCYAKQYFSDKNLALWFTNIYMMYDCTRVITTRLVGTNDFSVIVSHYKLSVIWNDKGTHSWLKQENMIMYDSIYEDLERVTQTLCFALMRTVLVNTKP